MNDPTYIRSEIDANPEWQLAFSISEIENDNAPIGWSKYIGLAKCLLDNYSIQRKGSGGGDAEWVCAVLYRVTEYLAKTGAFAEEDIAALRKALAMLDALHNGPKGTQTGGGDAGKTDA